MPTIVEGFADAPVGVVPSELQTGPPSAGGGPMNFAAPELRPALTEPDALEKIGTGNLCVLSETEGEKIYGRSLTVADLLGEDRVILTKWVRRLTNWNGRQAPLAVWNEKIAPLVE